MYDLSGDNCIYEERLTTNELLPDPKDLVFYEVCIAKREEDSMLVTGNMKHFPAKPFIVTPNEPLEIISNILRRSLKKCLFDTN
ncbi:MAG: hypothetical protein MRZ65_11230 [Lachnospiraceae bacterium]|nr:hypothetical protein [Lachnospiraceae bacterium]